MFGKSANTTAAPALQVRISTTNFNSLAYCEGLTSAVLLSKNSRYKITVAAKFMPGDYDIEYASPWAGANFFPVSLNDTTPADWDARTWPYLKDLAQNHPEAGIHFQGIHTCSASTGGTRTDRYCRCRNFLS